LDTFLNMVRDPGMTQLDLKSQLAANHVAKERIADLVKEFGSDALVSVARELIDQSEHGVRARLSKLPDGTWRARQYVDAAGYLTKVNLTATKNGDTLVYDFTGSAEQLPSVSIAHTGRRGEPAARAWGPGRSRRSSASGYGSRSSRFSVV
jgi:N-methylhydantoinase B